MKEIKCTIIQDVLPLYIDEVVSQDTKDLVEEHLKHCETCQKEYELMTQDLCIPTENKVPLFNKISKRWRKKKLAISIISVLTTAVIFVGALSYILYYETVIPYSNIIMKIEKQDDNRLVSHYFGKSYASVNDTFPMTLEIDGKKKNVSFIFYTKTFAKSPSRNLTNTEKQLNEQEYTSVLPESEKVEAVYYVDFDTEKITAGEDSWASNLKRAVLIWEK